MLKWSGQSTSVCRNLADAQTHVQAPLNKVCDEGEIAVNCFELLGCCCTDPDYQAFVQRHLNPVVEHLPSAEVQLDKRLAEEKELMAQHGGQLPPVITPLLADLKAKKLAKLVRALTTWSSFFAMHDLMVLAVTATCSPGRKVAAAAKGAWL